MTVCDIMTHDFNVCRPTLVFCSIFSVEVVGPHKNRASLCIVIPLCKKN